MKNNKKIHGLKLWTEDEEKDSDASDSDDEVDQQHTNDDEAYETYPLDLPEDRRNPSRNWW